MFPRILFFFAGLALVLGTACAKKEAPARDRSSKAKTSANRKPKSGTLKVTGESFGAPAELETALAILHVGDEAFRTFWKRQFETGEDVVSPFAAAAAKIQAHREGDKLKAEVESCPASKSQFEILLRMKDGRKSVSILRLRGSDDCAETDLPAAATFEFKGPRVLVSLHAPSLAEGFGRGLADARAAASCVAKLADGKVETLKCRGLGQWIDDHSYFRLETFEVIVPGNLVNARGEKIESRGQSACAGPDAKCIDFTGPVR